LKKQAFGFLLSLLSVTTVIAEDCGNGFEYIVRENQSLSEILWRQKFKPLYGTDGYIYFITELNQLKNPNQLFPNDKLILKKKCAPGEVVPQQPPPVAVQEPAVIETPAAAEPEEEKATPMALLAGAGVKTLSYDAQDDSNVETGSFVTNFNPTFALALAYFYNPLWTFELGYEFTQASVKKPSTLTLNSTTANLQTFSLSLKYLMSSSSRWQTQLLGGFERNEIPYLATGSSTDVELLLVSLNQGLIGVESLFLPEEKLNWILKAQALPLLSSQLSSGSFQAKSGIPFSLEAGPIYHYNEKWKFSLSAGYKRQDFKFSYESEDQSVQRTGQMTYTETEAKAQVQRFF